MMKKQKMQQVNRVRNQIITIKENQMITDDEGYEKPELIEIKKVYAKIRGLRGKEFFEAKQVQAEDIKTFNFKYFQGLTTSMYIDYKGRIYNIESINNIDERNFEYEVKASEVKSSE